MTRMLMTFPRAACLAALCAVGTCGAQGETAPASVLLPPAAASAPQARAIKQVIEDDAVRIEETRLRGQTQRITVQSKLRGVKGYEIIPPSAGKDPSQDRGAAGQRIWHLFDF
jgi:hypothetical protein